VLDITGAEDDKFMSKVKEANEGPPWYNPTPNMVRFYIFVEFVVSLILYTYGRPMPLFLSLKKLV